MNGIGTGTGLIPATAATPFDGIAFRVNGTPAPQGSKKGFVVKGRVVLVESSAKVKPWRAAVVDAAVEAMNGRPPLDGALDVTITYRLLKPRTVKRDFPTVTPDLDKLARSTHDALKTGGVVADDARFCRMTECKVYGTPGADITVRPFVAEAAA